MLKTIEKKIQSFVEGIGGIQRQEIVHGTLYVKLDNDRDCDFIHTEIRKFYKEFINPEGGVNMYAVGDEFAFDFVPEDREAPVFAEEGLQDEIDAEAEIQMQLDQDAKEGR